MYSKKQNFFKICFIVSVSFILGITTTVLAAVTYDANIQSRANKIFDLIKSNASTMSSSDKISYYNLVRMNITSLTNVLIVVDNKIATELGVTPGFDDNEVINTITNTGSNIHTGTTSFTCFARPSYLTPNNATFVYGTPTTTAGQAWQNSNSSSACYYACKTGFSGSQCTANVTTLSCLARPSYLTTTNTIFVDGTPATTAGQVWQNSSSSSACYYSCKTGFSGNQCTANATTDTNTNGYLVARQYASKFCMGKFYSDGFTTIKQNIPKAIQNNCTSGRCLISKFYWVAGGITVIHEDREDYWEQNNGMIDNIKCNADNGTNADVVRYNPSVKNQCQGIKDNGTQDYVTLDSNNQVSKLIKTCIKPLNGGLSCNEGRGGCCLDGQVSINTECVPQSDEGGYCYADTQCKPGLDCNNHSCHKDSTTYSWVENISSCRSDGQTEFGGKKIKSYSCKGSNGITDTTGNKCTGTKPVDEEIACTLTTSAANFKNFRFEYALTYNNSNYGYDMYEGNTATISSATVEKCIGTNCTSINVPKSDIVWTHTLFEDGVSGGNSSVTGNDTIGIIKWGRVLSEIPGGIGDVKTYDFGDYFTSRMLKITGKISNTTKYPTLNPLIFESNINLKNKFDAKLSKSQPLFQGYGVSRVFIELLGEDGYAEPGNAGLYYYNGACGITSSNSTVTPSIEFLGVNNESLSTSANSLPGSRFKIMGLENAPSGTKVDILCTLVNSQQGATRTITLSETN